MKIRSATENDIPSILELHNESIKTLTAIWTDTLENIEERILWLHKQQEQKFPVLIAEDEGGKFLGYASYGPYRAKSGYSLTAEHSVYVSEQARGRGAGAFLLEAIIKCARENGFHVLVAAIDSENEVSVNLHRKFGFKVTGILPEVGYKFGRWLDLTLMTLTLNRETAPQKKVSI
ncbi:GNAT family N-acetyltransferase [Flexibacterium corallicola]|uniref:GNAT family N-acetyltransferase n=1 Tax=Flexibacterium corallicola TaxID=3037259 RepID=UPI00286F2167|nr:N-acetyltransferase family protein [Pseudovibrio sp. M1P-2-3]